MPVETTANQFSQMIPFIVIAFIFYFIVFRPEEKEKQKKKKELQEKLKKNDQVVTAGDIHGTVVNIRTATVILRVDDNVKIEVHKDAI
ncbi:MAG TPA: preprotein translocase subunit YajC, partial [Candidatus Omnitrophota bacterium]|nr:preprotein translocase subunit YajC [Candidatus Omnitrophota bacterium]